MEILKLQVCVNIYTLRLILQNLKQLAHLCFLFEFYDGTERTNQQEMGTENFCIRNKFCEKMSILT